MTSNEPPPAVPEGRPAREEPEAFAPRSREPWVNPRKRTSLTAVAAIAALILLGGGIGIGAAVFGGNDYSHGWMMYERNGYRGFPGPAPFPGERGRPGYGGPWHMRKPLGPPRRAPEQNSPPRSAPSTPRSSGS